MFANFGVSRLSLLFICVVFAQSQIRQQVVDKGAQSSTAVPANAGSSEGSKYVGTETCKTFNHREGTGCNAIRRQFRIA